MYLQLFQDILGFISVTENPLIDTLILTIVSEIVHRVVYSFVGGLYNEGMINGSFAGRVAYLVGWAICLIPSALILFLLGRTMSFVKWIF